MKLIKHFIFLLLASGAITGCSVHNANEETIAIKAFNNQYVTVPGDTSCIKLVANRPDVGEWETFTISHLEGNTITIKANTNCYVCANYVAGDFLTADKRNASTWETFTLKDLGNNQVAIKASNGKYVSADQNLGYLLIANKEKAGEWEKFTLVKNP
ncbi:MAG: hypothetical protein HY958_05895 [Bacteroidia bacterium]|nr:hypothetical protein [Bacteroidia bacterium]